ncbi:hypothetical protein I79_019363 [Cricetulus griseus]|uniref:Uncharacterized protein n=1 Tax=Cricetulus griseus TaxID=10029 RepID=G3I778_CRIGR|nr:hypothetical protein I79_019363 [Cricetulus griseus]
MDDKSFGKTDKNHESPVPFLCPKAKAHLLQEAMAKKTDILTCNQKAILRGREKVANKPVFLLSQYFSWKTGASISSEKTQTLLETQM